ncbi:hypothetical protein [Vitiosangium sp. GDMCC 1.1324]|uniref:hypothetical protein n=1 Tax=Vitiosangium sp. (strain GDMCC 1.1324) TaxID=2138576 RepID=UPI000D369975|nr:hypothetical protein [Vitiosangium sp. GDMCC 1.1324]PTL75515.1 hypothetical protein DAT35_54645 [Vitiosangium sp. GDMCC 1.1324]
MKKMHAVLGCAVAAILAGSAAWAGSKYGYPVFIDLTQKKAYGTLGAARNSTDAVQLISCDAHAYKDGTRRMSCSAKNTSGTYVYCTSTVAGLVDSARSISGDSFIYFEWDTNGECTYLGVGHSSEYAPKQL